MASPVDFPGSNRLLGAPRGMEATVAPLHTFNNKVCSVSCWELSAAELEEIARTGRVWLSVFAGASQPPVYVGSASAVRGVVADYGAVWPQLAQPPAAVVAAIRTLLLARDALPEGVTHVRVSAATVDALLGIRR